MHANIQERLPFLRVTGAPPGAGATFADEARKGMHIDPDIYKKDHEYWKDLGAAIDDEGYMNYMKNGRIEGRK